MSNRPWWTIGISTDERIDVHGRMFLRRYSIPFPVPIAIAPCADGFPVPHMSPGWLYRKISFAMKRESRHCSVPPKRGRAISVGPAERPSHARQRIIPASLTLHLAVWIRPRISRRLSPYLRNPNYLSSNIAKDHYLSAVKNRLAFFNECLRCVFVIFCQTAVHMMGRLQIQTVVNVA